MKDPGVFKRRTRKAVEWGKILGEPPYLLLLCSFNEEKTET